MDIPDKSLARKGATGKKGRQAHANGLQQSTCPGGLACARRGNRCRVCLIWGERWTRTAVDALGASSHPETSQRCRAYRCQREGPERVEAMVIFKSLLAP